MKKLTWINGNKARIETGHKTFDKQCECISVGNVIGTCQASSYIRPATELTCNGGNYAPGHLQNFDLQNFNMLPERVREFCRKQPRSVILYEFRHWGKKHPYGERKKIVHGYIVTDGDYNLLQIFPTGYRGKSWDILNWCKDYISNP